jgi:CHAT domain-containing protein
VIGLPAGFLQAGVPGFIGTLWPVDDLASALLMTRFYEIILPVDKTTDPEPAAALREAMRWLRDLDNKELLTFFTRHRALKSQAGGTVALARSHPELRLFNDFVFWAAYSFIGACSGHTKEAPDDRRH